MAYHMRIWYLLHARIQGGGRGAGGPPPEQSQIYRVTEEYWFRSPKNHKPTNLAFNVGLSLARQWNAIWMSFRWRVYDDLL